MGRILVKVGNTSRQQTQTGRGNPKAGHTHTKASSITVSSRIEYQI